MAESDDDLNLDLIDSAEERKESSSFEGSSSPNDIDKLQKQLEGQNDESRDCNKQRSVRFAAPPLTRNKTSVRLKPSILKKKQFKLRSGSKSMRRTETSAGIGD